MFEKREKFNVNNAVKSRSNRRKTKKGASTPPNSLCRVKKLTNYPALLILLLRAE
jgi:hypothetical protein